MSHQALISGAESGGMGKPPLLEVHSISGEEAFQWHSMEQATTRGLSFTEALHPTVAQKPAHDMSHAIIAMLCFAGCFAMVFHPSLFDVPVVHAVNSLAGKSAAFDATVFDIDQYSTFGGGVFFVTFLWVCWFCTKDETVHSRLIAGTLAALPAGALSRSLQHHLHTHTRPYYSLASGFHHPVSTTVQLNSWNSFPSDHATVYGALVALIAMVRPDLRRFVFPWLAVAEFARLYIGAHSPTDLIGGAAFGAAVVFLSQDRWIVDRCRRLAAVASSRPALFYAIAFVLTYQVANLFADPREVLRTH